MTNEEIMEYYKYIPDATFGAVTIGVEQLKKLINEAKKLKEENRILKDVIKHNEELRCEENTKLKAEIEDLKNQILCKDMTIEELETEKNAYFTDLCKEREFHKSEIEQLKEFIDRLNNIHEQRLSNMMKEIAELKKFASTMLEKEYNGCDLLQGCNSCMECYRFDICLDTLKGE